jgi:O-antigen/teichoic acid export membrane protein
VFLASKSLISQAVIVLINFSTGIMITRAADYSLRASISIISSMIGICLVILNQGYFESLIKNYGLKHSKSILKRLIAMLLLSIGIKQYLGIDWRLTFVLFMYMVVNMYVQFEGTHIFHIFGNVYFLRLGIIFYSINLVVTGIIVFLNKLSVETWLIASLIADLCLLLIYRIKIPKNRTKNSSKVVKPNNLLSIAASISATQDFIIILIAKELTSDMHVAFLIVAYSCVSPFMIFLNAIQNNIIHNPQSLKSLLTTKIRLKTTLAIIILLIYGLLLNSFVTLIFGEKYSVLSDSIFLILLFGIINLILKSLSSVYRGTNKYGDSILLTTIFLLAFVLFANLLPTSDLMLLKASTIASCLSIVFSLILKLWSNSKYL